MRDAIGRQVPEQLSPGITRVQAGPDETIWRVLGHTYRLAAESESCFAFLTMDPPGSFVPPHIHPTQDEFIHLIEGRLDLYLDGQHHVAHAGDLVRMPRGIPHGYYNLTEAPTRALFWVTPARQLRALFDALHDLADLGEAVRLSALHEVRFLQPGEMTFDPLSLKV